MTAPTLSDIQVLLATVEQRVQAGAATTLDIDAAARAAIAASDQLAGWRAVESQARRLIEAMLETRGADSFTTDSGADVRRGKPVTVRTFNASALDALCLSYPDTLAPVLSPHRREHKRAGSVRVVRGAGSAANGQAGATNGAGARKEVRS